MEQPSTTAGPECIHASVPRGGRLAAYQLAVFSGVMVGLFTGIVLGVLWRYTWGYKLGTAFYWVLAGCMIGTIPMMIRGVRRDLKRFEWRFDGAALSSPSLAAPLPLADVQQAWLAVPQKYRTAGLKIVVGYAAVALKFSDGRRLILRVGPGRQPYVENGVELLIAVGKALTGRLSTDVYPSEKLPWLPWHRYNRLLPPLA